MPEAFAACYNLTVPFEKVRENSRAFFISVESYGRGILMGLRLSMASTKIEARVRLVYQLCNTQTNFESLVYPKQGHLHTPEMWRKPLTWLDDRLKNSSSIKSQ
jgi:hypothetical protein